MFLSSENVFNRHSTAVPEKGTYIVRVCVGSKLDVSHTFFLASY